MFDERPKREVIYMKTAYLWAARSLCRQENRKIGCIITTSDMRMTLSTGYNGPPRQLGNLACRGIGGNCGCLHAEQNAIAIVDGTLSNKILFVTMSPCESCASLIAQANISKVFYCADYRNTTGIERLKICGIIVIKMNYPV